MNNIRLYDIIFFLLIGVALIVTSNPKHNGIDELSYMAIVLSFDEDDMNKVHQQVFDDLDNVWDAKTKARFTDGSNWRSKFYKDVSVLEETMNYHRAKPLYIAMVWLLYHAGVSLPFATVLPNMISMFILLVVVYAWLRRYVTRQAAMVTISLIAVLPITYQLANGSISDTPAILFAVIAMYLLDVGGRRWQAILFLVLAFLTRLDYCTLIAAVFFFEYARTAKQRLIALGIAVVAVIGALFLPVLAGNPPDWILQYAYFKSPMAYVEKVLHVVLKNRLPYLLFFVLLGASLYRYGDDKARHLLKIAGVTTLLHILIFPIVKGRFIYAYELVVVVMLLKFLATNVSLPIGITAKKSVDE